MAKKRIIRVSVDVNILLTSEGLTEKKEALKTFTKELFDSNEVEIKLTHEEVEDDK